MRCRLAAALLLLIAAADSTRAGIIVLANRTAGEVTFTPTDSAKRTLASFEQAVLYTDGSINVAYTSGTEKRTYRLDPDSAYFFADQPGGITIHGIGKPVGEESGQGTAAGKSVGVVLKPPPVETIPVRIFVDEEEPASQAVWEARIRKRVATASDLLEKTCRVRFEVEATGTWESDNKVLDLPGMLTDFERKIPRDKNRLTIGFTSQRTPENPGILHLGGTRVPLYPYILMREWTPATEPGRLEVLLHELGHYLGAVHSPEMTSVMRPKLGDGRSVALKFPVDYDPLNTLAMNLIAAEIRSNHVRSLTQLTEPTKARLRRIYGEVKAALPDDSTPGKFITLLGPPPPKPEPPKPEPPPAPPPVVRAGGLERDARAVLAAIVKAAEKNRNLPERSQPGTAPPFRRAGDELTEYYFREAAIVARDLPQGQAAPAYLLALAIGLDTSDLFRRTLPTSILWRSIESDADRQRRLKVLGTPTMFGRHDSCQHFVDSAALIVVAGPAAAKSAGLVKEMLDSREGGSGFSFADLASDACGLAFGNEVLSEPGLLVRLADGFKVADFALPPDGLVEGLTYKEFTARFGSVRDDRFKAEVEKLSKRIRDLPAYNADAAAPVPDKPAEKPAAAVPSPVENPPAKAPVESKADDEKPPEKTAPQSAAAPSVSPPSLAPKAHPQGGPQSELKLPRSAIALAGLGLLSLASAFYVIWPRRAAAGRPAAVKTSALAGSVLALAGFALLGAAYARWSTVNFRPKESSSFPTDLDATWGEEPLDPFALPKQRVIRIPAFPGARGVWGATGRDVRGHIWFGVSASGEVEPAAHLMEYNPEADKVTDRGDAVAALRSGGLLRSGESQSSIRTRIVAGRDGCLYFTTTDEDETAYTDSRPVARGSHLWRLRPPDGKWEHLLAVPEKLIAIAVGPTRVCVLGYPDNVLYVYDVHTDETRSTRIGSVEGYYSSNILADYHDHIYVPRLRQEPSGIVATLVELNSALEEVAETPLDPPERPEADSHYGVRAWQPLADHSLAFVTGRGQLYRIVPGEDDRSAKVSALGPLDPRKEASIVSLFSPDGQRYLMGMGRQQTSISEGLLEWFVCDLRTGKPVAKRLPVPEEDNRPLKNLLLSGCMTRDDQGCFYLGGSHNRNGIIQPVLLQVRPAR